MSRVFLGSIVIALVAGCGAATATPDRAGPSAAAAAEAAAARRLSPAPIAGGPAALSPLRVVPPPSPTTDETPVPPSAPMTDAALAPTQRLIERLRVRLKSDPSASEAWLELGAALLQRVRETADPSLYPAAEAAFQEARDQSPGDPLPLVGLGTLQLARHQFASALRTGRQALAMVPQLSTATGVVVDALVELGRYDEATTAVQEMIDARPDLASYARVSYVRELFGDLPGALAAMEQAVEAGGGASENNAYVLVQAGNLLVLNGRPRDADAAYLQALRAFPDFPAALAAQGRAAVARGDLTSAAALFDHAAAIVPLPEYVIALGEARQAAGDAAGAADSYALARVETELFKANGVVVDLELALFEADHGDPAAALALAQQAYAERPTLKAADALAWALYKEGRLAEARVHSTEALRMHTPDPVLLYHAGVIAAASGDRTRAARDLHAALALDGGFSATGAAAARALLARLSH
jgi:tetratricopeptide (TPR) repeat protein